MSSSSSSRTPEPTTPPSLKSPHLLPHPHSPPALVSIVNRIFDDRPPTPSSMLSNTPTQSHPCSPPPDSLFDLPSPLQSALDDVPPHYDPIVSHLRHPELPPLSAIADYSRQHLASALAFWLNSRRAEGRARAVLVITRNDATARVWMETLGQHLKEILLTRLSTAKKSIIQVQKVLSGMIYPGVFVAAERAMKSEVMALMRKAMEESPHDIVWELCISDTMRSEAVNVEWGPIRMVADRVVERGLIVVCGGEQKTGALRRKDLENFVKKEMGKDEKVWWRRAEVEGNGNLKGNLRTLGTGRESQTVRETENPSISDIHEEEEDPRKTRSGSRFKEAQLMPVRNRRQVGAVHQKVRENESVELWKPRLGSNTEIDFLRDIQDKNESGGLISTEGADPRDNIVPRHTRLEQRQDCKSELETGTSRPLGLKVVDKRKRDVRTGNNNSMVIRRGDANPGNGKLPMFQSQKLRGAALNVEGQLQTSGKNGQKGRRRKIFIDNSILEPVKTPSREASQAVGAEKTPRCSGNIAVGYRDRADKERIISSKKEHTKRETIGESSLGIERPLGIDELQAANKGLNKYWKSSDNDPDTDSGVSSIFNIAQIPTLSRSKKSFVNRKPENGGTARGREPGRSGQQSVHDKDYAMLDTLTNQGKRLSRGKGKLRKSFDGIIDLDEQLGNGTSSRTTWEEPAKRGNSADRDSLDDCHVIDKVFPIASGIGSNHTEGRKRSGRGGRKICEDFVDLDETLAHCSVLASTDSGPGGGPGRGGAMIADYISDLDDPFPAVARIESKRVNGPKRGSRPARKNFHDSTRVDEPLTHGSGTGTSRREACVKAERAGRRFFGEYIDVEEPLTTGSGSGTSCDGLGSRVRRGGRRAHNKVFEVDEAGTDCNMQAGRDSGKSLEHSVDSDGFDARDGRLFKDKEGKKGGKEGRVRRGKLFQEVGREACGEADILRRMQKERDRISRLAERRAREEQRCEKESGGGAGGGGLYGQRRGRAKTFLSEEVLRNGSEGGRKGWSASGRVRDGVGEAEREVGKWERKKENERDGGSKSGGYRVCELDVEWDESDVGWHTPTGGGWNVDKNNGGEWDWSEEGEDFVTPLSSPKRSWNRENVGTGSVGRGKVAGRKREFVRGGVGTVIEGGEVTKPKRASIGGGSGGATGVYRVRAVEEKRRMSWSGNGERRGVWLGRRVESREERMRREKQRRNLRGEELLGMKSGVKRRERDREDVDGENGKVVVCLDGTFRGGKMEVDGEVWVGGVAVDGLKRRSRGREVRDGRRGESGGRVRKVRSGGGVRLAGVEKRGSEERWDAVFGLVGGLKGGRARGGDVVVKGN